MPDPTRIDPERLAALIDGRLGEADAARVRAQLANADAETLAAYADAVALAQELRAEDAAAPAVGVTPIGSAPSRLRRRWLAPALAAAAAGVVAVAILERPRGAASVATVADGLTTAPLGVPEWSSVRSSDGAATDRGRAVRIGVLLVQYELAARRQDSAAASRAAMIAALLEGVPGGSAGAMRWRAVASGAGSRSQEARAADVAVAQSLVDPTLVSLGSWLESARSAAAANQPAWFDANGSAPLSRAAASSQLTPAEREAIAAVERSEKARPLDLAAISAAVAAAERTLGR